MLHFSLSPNLPLSILAQYANENLPTQVINTTDYTDQYRKPLSQSGKQTGEL